MLSNLKMWSYLSKENNSSEHKDSEDSVKVEVEEKDNNETLSNASVTDKASEWGSYLLEAGKAATSIAAKQVSSTAKSLRQNVNNMHIIEKGNIISNFSNEQIKFKSEKRCLEKKTNEICLPWIDALNYSETDEQNLKLKILSVSTDERNFTRNPPAGSDFEFNCVLYSPVAMLLLKEDPKLAEMRFKLVPKKIKEEIFWRNYFYRISLIKQSVQGNTDQKESVIDKPRVDVTLKESPVKENTEEIVDSVDNRQLKQLKTDLIKSGSINHQRPTDNEDWEAELQKELSEFELINEDNGKELNDLEEKVDFDDLEKEIMNELEK